MQITIVQAEIERAIRDYVGNQLRVADGMEMTIELAATRGSTGFTASIDIRPIQNRNQVASQAPAPASRPASQPQALSAQATLVAHLSPVQQEEIAMGQGNTQPTAEPKVASIFGGRPPRTPEEVRQMMDAEAQDEPDPTVPVSQEEASSSEPTETSTETGDEQPKPAARSLFKGLKRPVNG